MFTNLRVGTVILPYIVRLSVKHRIHEHLSILSLIGKKVKIENKELTANQKTLMLKLFSIL